MKRRATARRVDVRDTAQFWRQEHFDARCPRCCAVGSLGDEVSQPLAQRRRPVRVELFNPDQKDSWFLDAVETYCDTVNRLVHDLSLVDVQSCGFLAFRDYLTAYAKSEGFLSLLAETKKLKTDLSSVKYCILIKGNGFKVRKYQFEGNYSADVEETFEKFKQGEVKSYAAKFSSWPDMNTVEAKVLDFVALLYHDIFSNLHCYCANHRDYLDQTIGLFDREIQFYVSYLEYIARFKRAGLKFCYPRISKAGSLTKNSAERAIS